MKEIFKEFNLSAKTKELIHTADGIIGEYQEQGYELTLRQLYYQFVARDLLPNTARSYNNLGVVVNKGRLTGMLDWAAIVDRTRECKVKPTWASAVDILRTARNQFRLNKWLTQDTQVEVWVEKEALAQVVQRAVADYGVPWFCCRGYPSQSAMYEAAKRHLCYQKPVVVLHLGDHDPSGIDMTRDIEDRLLMFDANTSVRRIALNLAQVRTYNPPPNPAKVTDSRAAVYRAMYGDSSWELDALEPAVMERLIVHEIRTYILFEKWDACVAKEEAQRLVIKSAEAQIHASEAEGEE